MKHKNSNGNQRPPSQSYRFGHSGEFTLVVSERRLTHNAEAVQIPPKAFDALVILLRNAKHLVTKEELIDHLWPKTYVSEANLTNTIVSLRKVLGKNAIRTVSKHGYEFSLPVSGEHAAPSAVEALFARGKEFASHRSLESFEQARELFWHCIAEDPNHAAAWAWMARCSWLLAKIKGAQTDERLQMAESSFRRAFAIDPDLAIAHQMCTPMEIDTGNATRAMMRLRKRVSIQPDAESYAGLVHAYRFCGLLKESTEAHKTATELKPGILTSIPHTQFLTGDYAGALDTYSGRGSFYLDAAVWAVMGREEHARSLLKERLVNVPVVGLIGSLMRSLLAALEGRADDATQLMKTAEVRYEPETLFLFARHYSYMDCADSAVQSLLRARDAGFQFAPETLHNDAWLAAARKHPKFNELLREAEQTVARTRKQIAD